MSKHPIKPIDKTTWGDGPWQTEPDRVEWEHAGLPCLMVRHPTSGHWCGYAAVSPGHPAHAQDYSDLEMDVQTHGGLTYAASCRDQICHVPKPGEPDDVWWFGFDCAHAGDYSPAHAQYNSRRYSHEAAVAANTWQVDTYRTLDYVRDEVNRLAEQLAARRGHWGGGDQ